jgi:N-terminal domain of galactosyltransferase
VRCDGETGFRGQDFKRAARLEADTAMRALQRGRNLAGVLLKDWWRYRRALRARDAAYLSICNRNERLERAPGGHGYRCDWQWTSDLHATKYLPTLGVNLMKRALADHPLRCATRPARLNGIPEVSFIIGHRGQERLPHLLLTLESIAAQRDVAIECIVVEQAAVPETRERLPSWIRYLHTPLPYPEMPYCRPWAFNVGARAARSEVLVLHDNDMLVPDDYCKEILTRFDDGYEVVNLKRFIFFLTEEQTRRVFSGNGSLTDEAPESIMQNSEGGGSIAVARDAYFAIGGFDEAFIGWGGEDNEFWQRAQTRQVWPYGCLPLVHLWHPAQHGKWEKTRPTTTLFEAKSAISPAERIAKLTACDFGNLQFAPVKVSANEG